MDWTGNIGINWDFLGNIGIFWVLTRDFYEITVGNEASKYGFQFGQFSNWCTSFTIQYKYYNVISNGNIFRWNTKWERKVCLVDDFCVYVEIINILMTWWQPMEVDFKCYRPPKWHRVIICSVMQDDGLIDYQNIVEL